MGDLSGEPSMEDILASIKRVIKEGEAPAPRRAPPRAEEPHADDAVLELNQPIVAPPPPSPSLSPTTPSPSATLDAFEERLAAVSAAQALRPTPAASPSAPTPAPSTPAAPAPTASAPPVAAIDEFEPIGIDAAPIEPEEEAPVVSPATVEATRGALDTLSRLIVKPEPEGDGTLEGLVRDMLRPMLSEWLDQNLPRLVEQMVAREIARITSSKA